MGYYMAGGPPGPRWPRWMPSWLISRLEGAMDTLALINAVFGIILPVFGLFVAFALLCFGGIWLLSVFGPK